LSEEKENVGEIFGEKKSSESVERFCAFI